MKRAVLAAAWLSGLPTAFAQVSTVSVGYCPSDQRSGSGGNGGTGAGDGSGAGNGNGGGPSQSTTLGVEPYIDSSYGTYEFNGFYPISSDRDILNGKSTTTSSMTQEYCASFCQGSNYFAISEGVTCTCGSDPPTGNPVYSPAQSIACAGNGKESCGSPGYAIVYRLSGVGPGGETVIDYTTTNSDGSVSTGKITSKIPPASASISEPPASGSPGSGTLPTGSGSGGAGPSATNPVSSNGGSGSGSSSAAGGGGGSVTSDPSFPSSTSGARYPCPALDASLYSLADGDAYNVQCSVNYPGNDLTTQHLDTFAECIAACDSYVPDPDVAGGKACVAVTFGEGNPGGNCYLKYAITTIVTNDQGLDSASSADYIPVNPVSSAAGGGSNPGPSAGNGNSASNSLSGGGTVQSPTNNGGAPASVTNGGTNPSPTNGGSNPGSGSSSSSGPGSSPSPTGDFANYTPIGRSASCPADNNALRVEPLLSVEYGVNCDRNLDGDNLLPLHADTFDTCLGSCSLRKGCVGVTWAGGDTEPTRDNCYPYSLIRGYSSRALQNELYVGVSVDGPVNATEYQTDICTDPQDPQRPTTYLDLLGTQYTYACGKEIVEGDTLDDYAADSLAGCITYCSIYDTCKAVVFTGTGAPPPNTANCIPYSRFTAGTVRNNAGAAYAYGT